MRAGCVSLSLTRPGAQKIGRSFSLRQRQRKTVFSQRARWAQRIGKETRSLSQRAQRTQRIGRRFSRGGGRGRQFSRRGAEGAEDRRKDTGVSRRGAEDAEDRKRNRSLSQRARRAQRIGRRFSPRRAHRGRREGRGRFVHSWMFSLRTLRTLREICSEFSCRGHGGWQRGSG